MTHVVARWGVVADNQDGGVAICGTRPALAVHENTIRTYLNCTSEGCSAGPHVLSVMTTYVGAGVGREGVVLLLRVPVIDSSGVFTGRITSG